MKKIDSLEPEFKTQVETLLEALETVSGVKWIVTSGRRTMAQQQALYDQGRTTPGQIVTKAPPGSSAHNFGYAVDLVPLNKVGEAWWNCPDRYWKMLGELCEGMHLVWGGNFSTIVDKPHVESPAWRIAKAEWKAGNFEVV